MNSITFKKFKSLMYFDQIKLLNEMRIIKSNSQIAEEWNISVATFYNFLKKKITFENRRR